VAVDVPGSQQRLLPDALLPDSVFGDLLFVGSDGRVRMLARRPYEGPPPSPFPIR
jgi:hypothetical protein